MTEDTPHKSEWCHENYRIALYYCYTPIDNVDHHVSFQRNLCTKLLGRIRVSPEGMNGVLSGLYNDLLEYEERTKQELALEDLDVKYCSLRSDLPVSSQLFTSLSIKATREVVSLYELTPEEVRESSKQTRRRRRRRQQPPGGPHEQDSGEHHDDDTAIPKSPNDLTLQNYDPAPHLSPREWNALLSQCSNDDAILLDARNVYESRVGHFSVPGVPTLLTNTRKYSSLPQVLESTKANLAGKKVFMYCTGGVRCERASVYLQALAESNEWGDKLERPKGIYQLKGGIQRYLEEYGTVANTATNEECLFHGKNFVFDPRRTDPLVGPSCTGKCLVCRAPHDDYDNGHAPCENKEARCCKCRVLVLVCDSCRNKVRSWGEELDDGNVLPDLYCGESHCIDQGNSVQPAIV